MMSKFRSHEEFEKNLTDYLREQSALEGLSVDQIKNEVAYERFLARMDPERMTIKDGYAVKSQVPISPYTKDIDMILVEPQLPSEKSKLPRAARASRRVVCHLQAHHFSTKADPAPQGV